MKKLIVAFIAVMLVLVSVRADYRLEIDTRSTAEKIVESVVIVEQSSGIVIYSEANRSIILTALHNILNLVDECPDCWKKINVYVLAQTRVGADILLEIPIVFDIVSIEKNEKRDLVLIEINTDGVELEHVDIFKKDLKLAQDIFLIGNPLGIYRSLKKGYVSSVFRIIRDLPATELQGGVIFGSSGGGVFTINGKLAGIILSIPYWTTDYCKTIHKIGAKVIKEECVNLPIPYIAFAATPETIREFILNSKFNKNFKYLSE